jgi:hypothetical protein
VPRGSGGGMLGNGGWTGLAFGRLFAGRGLATPVSVAQRRNYRYTSDTDHAFRTRLMRSQGCQRRASVTPLLPLRPRTAELLDGLASRLPPGWGF